MAPKPLDICLCTMDFVGPIRNGGIGTAYHALAYALKEAGHRVTVLYALGEYCEGDRIGRWVEYYRNDGIEFVPLPSCGEPRALACQEVRVSYEIYLWLAAQDRSGRAFDVIHFHEWRGLAFYSVLAKHQGLALGRSVLCVGTHSPESWHRWGMAQFITSVESLKIDHIERVGIELADVVVSPSAYMLQWIADQGWKLPDDSQVCQNILTQYLPPDQLANPQPQRIDTLVFFGRLETRKGLALFCDALDLLNAELEKLQSLNGNAADSELAALAQMRVIFLGKKALVDNIESEAYLEFRSRGWRFSWQAISDLDHAGAMNLLAQPGRMAVIPSLLENSPYTLLECLGKGVACVCSDLPGHRELLHPADADRVCFPLRKTALAEMLKQAVVGGMTPPRLAIHPQQTKAQWLAWHEQIAGAHPGPAPSADHPRVSVCMTHRNRPGYLRQALDSVRRQDYPNFQLILVDDGSDMPEAIEYLKSLEEEFNRRNWKLIRQPNRYPGAARNTAVRASDGQWILFMDDDNVAMPHEVSTFVTAALASNADILTCLMECFEGDDAPGPGTPNRHLWLPLGGAIAVGFFVNLFGDTNGLIRRDVYEKLGGYTEDFGVIHEDWEFYANAALAGFKIQVVPEVLFWYRVRPPSMVRTTNVFINNMRNLRPYLAAVHPEMRGVVQLAQGTFLNPAGPMEIPPPLLPAAAPAASAPITEIIDPTGPQRLVDEYWNSLSWRLSGIVRRAVCKISRMQPPQRPVVSSQRDAFIAIEHIRRSISWEATGPLRAMGRTYHALKSKVPKSSDGA